MKQVQAIVVGGGFGWLKPPPRKILNKYWNGIVLIQNRKLIVGRFAKKSKTHKKTKNDFIEGQYEDIDKDLK